MGLSLVKMLTPLKARTSAGSEARERMLDLQRLSPTSYGVSSFAWYMLRDGVHFKPSSSNLSERTACRGVLLEYGRTLRILAGDRIQVAPGVSRTLELNLDYR